MSWVGGQAGELPPSLALPGKNRGADWLQGCICGVFKMGTPGQSAGRAGTCKSQRMDWYLLRDCMLAVSTSWRL